MTIEPEITSALAARHGPDLTVDRTALISAEAASGAVLEQLTVWDASGINARYVVKRLKPLGDWIARATRDDRMREYRFAASPVPGALPAGIRTAVIHATLLADGGAALIMRDVHEYLSPPGDERFSEQQATQMLVTLAQLHSTFYGFPSRLTSDIGLCTLASWLTLLAPATGQREAGRTAHNSVPSRLVQGWEAFARLAPAAWRVVEPLLADPRPAVVALRECPDTLLHGDPKAGNIAFEQDALTLLDWGLCTRAPGAIDLGWLLAVNSAKLPFAPDESIEIYRSERERRGRLPAQGEPWQRELALGLLAGTMRLGWAKALGAGSNDPQVQARESIEVEWWAEAASQAVRWMEHGS